MEAKELSIKFPLKWKHHDYEWDCYAAAATTSTPIEVDWNHTEIPSPFGIVEMDSAKVCPETNKYIQ